MLLYWFMQIRKICLALCRSSSSASQNKKSLVIHCYFLVKVPHMPTETTHQEKTIITQKKKNGAGQKCLEKISVKKERKKINVKGWRKQEATAAKKKRKKREEKNGTRMKKEEGKRKRLKIKNGKKERTRTMRVTQRRKEEREWMWQDFRWVPLFLCIY